MLSGHIKTEGNSLTDLASYRSSILNLDQTVQSVSCPILRTSFLFST